MINESGATIVWTALRAPKQDILDSMITPYLNDGIVMVGVGAAFRSFIGELKQPDGLAQKLGLAGIVIHRSNVSWWWELKFYSSHILYLMKYFLTIKWRRLRGIPYYA